MFLLWEWKYGDMISISLHIIGEGDEITKVASLLKLVAGWRSIMKLIYSTSLNESVGL